MVVMWAVLAGGLGATARYGLSALVDSRLGRGGTIVVNLIGSALAGAVTQVGLAEGVHLVVAVGGLGGFTTFSTWMLDALGHQPAEQSLRYAAFTLVAGLAAAGLGMGAVAIAG